jgi:hypothetical protein
MVPLDSTRKEDLAMAASQKFANVRLVASVPEQHPEFHTLVCVWRNHYASYYLDDNSPFKGHGTAANADTQRVLE